MQAQVDEKKRQKEDDLESTQVTEEDNPGFSFQPVRARSVPDFRRI